MGTNSLSGAINKYLISSPGMLDTKNQQRKNKNSFEGPNARNRVFCSSQGGNIIQEEKLGFL